MNRDFDPTASRSLLRRWVASAWALALGLALAACSLEEAADPAASPAATGAAAEARPEARICQVPPAASQRPYAGTPWAIPGAVEAEAYDEGGEGAAYHDLSTGNEGGALRGDDVDVKTVGSGHAVGWWQAGEWLAYTVDVAAGGAYRVDLRVGSPLPGRTLALFACGAEVARDVAIPIVSTWGETERASALVKLPAGRQVLRVELGAEDYADFDGLEIAAAAQDGSGGAGGEGAGGFAAVVAGIRPRGPQCGAYARSTPTGGTEYFVATTGSDAAAGTSGAPFRTLQHAADVAQAGDVVTIGPGSYVGSVTVKATGTAAEPIVFQAAECGTVLLTGNGDYSFRAQSFSSNWQSCVERFVTLKGLVFREYAKQQGDPGHCHGTTIAVGMCTGWRVEDSTFERAGDRAIAAYGSDLVVARTRIAESYGYAIVGAGEASARIHDLLFRDLVLEANNPTGLLHPACGASVKILFSDRVKVENIESFGNVGPGWWFDWDNYDWQIRDSYFHDNRGKDADWQGPGVWLEGPGSGGLVEHNVFRGNAGPAVGILETHGHTLRDNLFAEDGLEIRGIEEGARHVPSGLEIVDNFFRLVGTYTSIGDFGGKSPLGQGYRIDRNTYEIGSTPLLTWAGVSAASVAEMQAKFGLEESGVEAPVPWPPVD